MYLFHVQWKQKKSSVFKKYTAKGSLLISTQEYIKDPSAHLLFSIELWSKIKQCIWEKKGTRITIILIHYDCLLEKNLETILYVQTKWQNIPCSWIGILDHVIKVSLTEQEVEQWLPKTGSGENGEKLIRGCKLSAMRWINAGKSISSMVTIVNTVLYTWNLLR